MRAYLHDTSLGFKVVSYSSLEVIECWRIVYSSHVGPGYVS